MLVSGFFPLAVLVLLILITSPVLSRVLTNFLRLIHRLTVHWRLMLALLLVWLALLVTHNRFLSHLLDASRHQNILTLILQGYGGFNEMLSLAKFMQHAGVRSRARNSEK